MKDIFVRVPYHRTVFATFENLFESKYKVNDVDPKPIEFNYKKLKNNYFVVRMLHKTDLKKGFKIRGKVFPEICREKKKYYIEKNTVEIIGTGSYIPNNNSKEYCPSCEESRAKAVAKAFKKIKVRFKYEFIETKEFSLNEILKIEQDQKDAEIKKREEREAKGEVLFPMMTQVWATLYNMEKGENQKYRRVKHEGGLYSYRYWPSSPEKAEIMVEKRIDTKTCKPVSSIRRYD